MGVGNWLEQTPYPFPTQLIWRYLGFIVFIILIMHNSCKHTIQTDKAHTIAEGGGAQIGARVEPLTPLTLTIVTESDRCW